MPYILTDFGVSSAIANSGLTRDLFIAGFAVFIFPFNLMKDLYSLRYASVLGFVAVIYIIIVIEINLAIKFN